MKIGVQVHLKSGKAVKAIVAESESREKLCNKFIISMSKRKKKFLEIKGNNQTVMVPKESVEFIVLEDLNNTGGK